MWESYRRVWWRLLLFTLYLTLLFVIARILDAVAYYERGAGYLASQLIDPVSLGVHKLKLVLDQRGVSYAGVVEKTELTSLIDASGEVTESDIAMATSAAATSDAAAAPHHFTGGAHFYEEVEDSKDSLWVVHVVRGAPYMAPQRWAQLVARLAPFGVRVGVFDCSLDVRLCDRKKWLSSRLVVATPRGDRAKSNVVLHTYQGAPWVQSTLDWINAILASRIDVIASEEELERDWLHGGAKADQSSRSEENNSSDRISPDKSSAGQSSPVRVVLFTESAIPAMFFSVLSVKFAGRIKFGVVKVRSAASRRLVRRLNIRRLPCHLVATPETNYTYGAPHRSESLSQQAMALFLRSLQPEANDAFLLSLVALNAACLLHLVAAVGTGMLRRLVAVGCNAVRWNALLLLLWLPLLAACRLDCGQRVVSALLTAVRLVALTPLAACARSDWLAADATAAAVAAAVFVGVAVVLRLTSDDAADAAASWTLDAFTSYLLRPASAPPPWSSDPEAGAVGMLIERMAVPNFWLRPITTPAYLDALPVWPHPGDDTPGGEGGQPELFVCERCRRGGAAETAEECARAASACAKLVMDGDYKCACRGDAGGGGGGHGGAREQPGGGGGGGNSAEGEPPPGMIRATECAVCLEAYHQGALMCGLPCRHVFHERCIMGWLTRDNRCCPICRWPAYRAKPCHIHQHAE